MSLNNTVCAPERLSLFLSSLSLPVLVPPAPVYAALAPVYTPVYLQHSALAPVYVQHQHLVRGSTFSTCTYVRRCKCDLVFVAPTSIAV